MTLKALVDYTTLHDATIMTRATYSLPPREWNNFKKKSKFVHIKDDSSIWISLASIAETVENMILFDNLYTARLGQQDSCTIRELTRMESVYGYDYVSFLTKKGILKEFEISLSELHEAMSYVNALAKIPSFRNSLIKSILVMLEQPGYRSIPKLFSYTSSVYKDEAYGFWTQLNDTLINKIEKSFLSQLQQALERQPSKSNYIVEEYGDEIIGFYLRGLLYTALSQVRGMPYCPHSARTPVVAKEVLSGINRSGVYAKIAVQKVEELRSELANKRNEFLHNNVFELRIPSLLAIVLRESKDQSDVLKVAYQLRESKGATALRQWSAELVGAVDGNTKELDDLREELDSLVEALRKEVGLTKQEGEMQLWFLSAPIRIPKILQRVFVFPGKKHQVFLRDLFRKINELRAVDDLFRIYHASWAIES